MEKCAPGKNYKEGSCFSIENLINISLEINKKFKSKIILKKDKKYLLKQINSVMKNKYNCEHQMCWLNTNIIENMNDDDINFFTFRPDGPEDSEEWLSTSDIDNVMKQYEKKNNNFIFLGAVPLDFMDLPFLGINNLNFNELLKKNIYELGIVINLDKHTEGGSHWVGLYSNLKKNKIYFFDSFAKPPHKEIKKFITKIFNFLYEKEYSIKFDKKFFKNKYNSLKNFDVRFNKKRHQYKNSQCGVYSMNFILRLLKKNETFDDISLKVTSDNEMVKCRDVYFN